MLLVKGINKFLSHSPENVVKVMSCWSLQYLIARARCTGAQLAAGKEEAKP